MIKVQALNNNRHSKIARRKERPPVDDSKPIAMEITHHHNDVRTTVQDMPHQVLRLSVRIKKQHRTVRTGMSIYGYLSKDGLLIISLGLGRSADEFEDDILSLDDESLHRLVSIIVYHTLDRQMFSDRQLFFIDLGRCVQAEDGNYHKNAKWYAGNLRFIEHLGGKHHQNTTLYYDGTNKLYLRYDIH